MTSLVSSKTHGSLPCRWSRDPEVTSGPCGDVTMARRERRLVGSTAARRGAPSCWNTVLLLVVLLCASSLVTLTEGSRSGYPRGRARSRWHRQVTCPKECACRDRNRKVDCTSRALNYIPSAISKTVKRL
ncbi:hypothetical protein ACOMHN_046959 [Nucella lapillus]